MTKGFIYSDQQALFGSREVIGFGTSDFYVKEISWSLAKKIIAKNHYARKTDSRAHNKINLGIYVNNKLLGVLQYGLAMNPSSCTSIVAGTKISEYLELNRMWLDDNAPKNSESKAISYSVKYIKSKFRKIKWIQSFADERCGGLGIVYQACSFDYYGEHTSTFWEIDGKVYHNSILTNSNRNKKAELEAKHDLSKATEMTLRQFRYIKFLDSKWKKKCLLSEQKYLKHYNND